MELAPNEVVNPPSLQPIELSPSSNTTTTNSNNIGLQQTLWEYQTWRLPLMIYKKAGPDSSKIST